MTDETSGIVGNVGSQIMDETAAEAEPQRPRSEKDGAAQPARGRRRLWLAFLALVVLAAGGGFGWYWWSYLRFFQSTNDAYLQADMVEISPRVTGYLVDLHVTDNQAVRRGDPLLKIDDREYRAAVEQAQADVDGSNAQLAGLAAQIAQQQTAIGQAQAQVESDEAGLSFAQQEYDRYEELARRDFGTRQREQQTDASLREAKATLNRSQLALANARQQLDVLHASEDGARAQLLRNQAALDRARLDLEWTSVVSPVDGVIGNRSGQLGMLVEAGTNLMSAVPMGADLYLVANFKETQLERMLPGQAVSLSIDAFSGHDFKGTVNSLSPGTGSQFALLPAENATGNFTKIVQRVPVKILLDPADPMVQRLRPGLSVVATIDTRVLPPTPPTGAVAGAER